MGWIQEGSLAWRPDAGLAGLVLQPVDPPCPVSRLFPEGCLPLGTPGCLPPRCRPSAWPLPFCGAHHRTAGFDEEIPLVGLRPGTLSEQSLLCSSPLPCPGPRPGLSAPPVPPPPPSTSLNTAAVGSVGVLQQADVPLRKGTPWEGVERNKVGACPTWGVAPRGGLLPGPQG